MSGPGGPGPFIAKPAHTCNPPFTPDRDVRPDWQCGECGRVFRFQSMRWHEIVGPRPPGVRTVPYGRTPPERPDALIGAAFETSSDVLGRHLEAEEMDPSGRICLTIKRDGREMASVYLSQSLGPFREWLRAVCDSER